MPVIERYEAMKMLSSSASSQYLPPDYLQPLPTTLDAKNSPLALLAQTCSSIGKDPPGKSIIPPIEKKDISNRSPLSGSDDDIKSVSPCEKDGKTSANSQRSSRISDNKEISNFYPISTSSPKPDKSPSVQQKTKEDRTLNDSDTKPPQCSSKTISSSSAISGLNGLKSNIDRASPRTKTSDFSKEIRDPKYSPPLKSQRSETPIRRENSPGQEAKHPHSFYPGLTYGPFGLSSMPYPGSMPPSAEVLAGYPNGLPGHSGYSLATAHALAVHHAALKSGSSALSQYLQYARMRNPAGSTPCKDPYCTNCVAPPPSTHLAQCTSPGCVQCSHEKTFQGLGLYGLQGSNPLSSPFNMPTSASFGLAHLHNLYAQNFLTQHGQQHVCNWMMGSDYCGKRFNSSEELLQHLRTHTSGGESALSAYSSLGLSIPSASDLPPGLQGYLGSSGNISPETLRRMYPTSLSPLSGSTLSSRYHPYKSAMSNLPNGLPPHQALSSIGPYYSPYSVYAQRIGSASVP